MHISILSLANAAFLPHLQGPFLPHHHGPHDRMGSVVLGLLAPVQQSRAATHMGVLDVLLNRDDAAATSVVSATFDSSENAQLIQSYKQRVARINDMEDDIEELSDDELAAKTAEFRERLARGETELEASRPAPASSNFAALQTAMAGYSVDTMQCDP